MPQEPRLPDYLSHYPLKYVEYFDHDGTYAGCTDAHYISFGVSTWSDQDLSLKVWRKGGRDDKWLRQSEELPLHRPIDLTLLLLFVLDQSTQMPPGTLEKQPNSIEIKSNPPHSPRTPSIEQYDNRPGAAGFIQRRLNSLYEKLRDLRIRA